jgi:hypothetical protein
MVVERSECRGAGTRGSGLWSSPERVDVVRLHDIEVASIYGGDLRDPQSFGGRDDGRVHGAER